MEKGVIAQQPRGKRKHSTAAEKEKIWRSSVEKVDMALHGGKSRYGTAPQKSSHSAAVWRECMAQQRGKIVIVQQSGKSSLSTAAF